MSAIKKRDGKYIEKSQIQTEKGDKHEERHDPVRCHLLTCGRFRSGRIPPHAPCPLPCHKAPPSSYAADRRRVQPHGNGLCHRGFVMFHIRRDPHDGTTIGLHLGMIVTCLIVPSWSISMETTRFPFSFRASPISVHFTIAFLLWKEWYLRAKDAASLPNFPQVRCRLWVNSGKYYNLRS